MVIYIYSKAPVLHVQQGIYKFEKNVVPVETLGTRTKCKILVCFVYFKVGLVFSALVKTSAMLRHTIRFIIIIIIIINSSMPKFSVNSVNHSFPFVNKPLKPCFIECKLWRIEDRWLSLADLYELM